MTERNTKDERELTPKQAKAVPHLIASKTLKEGCRKARISRKTLYTWLQAPAFREELKKQRDIITQEALEVLKNNVTKAVNALITLLDTTDNDGLKRYLAKDVIDYVIRAKEVSDLEERLVKVEKIIMERRTYK